MGIGVTELMVILAIVVVLFGTKKLRGLGGDVGSAIQSFRKAMQEGDNAKTDKPDHSVEDQSGPK